MTHSGMAQALKVLLADTYTLYLKTQNYHWNVTGPDFFSLHKMFEEQYEALAEATDEIAERIRALAIKSPGSFAEFSSLKTISEARNDITGKEMIAELKTAHEQIAKHLELMIEQAGKENDVVTQDLLIERLGFHDKTIWMLAAHL